MPKTLSTDAAEPQPHRYRVYGATVHSDIPLALPAQDEGGLAHVQIRIAPAEYFAAAIAGVPCQTASDSWYTFAFLPDGSTYVRWDGVGEFLAVADGSSIFCRQHTRATSESFQVYMLGQALSFALVKQGFEPLHATAVVIAGKAVAFLGDCGFGKSTLAASFLAAGHRLLTDDLLILRASPDGLVAYPGPARIKSFRPVARRFLGEHIAGALLNPGTRKLILPLNASNVCSVPVPLAAIYALSDPREGAGRRRIQLDRLSPRESFVTLVRHAFNIRLVQPERLRRQFTAASTIIDTMAVRRLRYPRRLARIPDLHQVILQDLASECGSSGALACA